MKKFLLALMSVAFLAVSLMVSQTALAHEVYVLNQNEIHRDLQAPPLDFISTIKEQELSFIVSGFLGISVVVLVLGISVSRKLENLIDPILFKIKPYAGHIAQATLGLSLLASAYNNSLFGAELPLPLVFGDYALKIRLILYLAGTSVLFGLYPRVGSMLGVLVYSASLFGPKSVYMLSYLTYFGEACILLIIGSQYTIIKLKNRFFIKKNWFTREFEKREYFVLRLFFGTSLIYAAFYAKFIHGALALDTISKYNLTSYFPFDPMFIVLGAFVIENIIGLFYLLGFEIRFTSLFFLVFLSMSLVFFGESVCLHLVLIGTAVTLFVHGYDKYTIEKSWYISGKKEPVL